jgi:hypothetical protein
LEAQARLHRCELLDEARAFFALPLAEQLAEIEAITPELQAQGFTAADCAHLRQTLIQHYRPLEAER